MGDNKGQSINMIHTNRQGSAGVINMRHHVIRLISEAEITTSSYENRRHISTTNHLSNLLNQHTWMTQSKHSLFTNCTDCESASQRGRKLKKKAKNNRDLARMGQREIHLPICIATSLQGHQKQIRCCSKWPWEIVSGKSEQSADLSSRRSWSRAASHWADTDCTLWRIQFGYAAHQTGSDLSGTNPICLQPFVRTVRPGLHAVVPIQFAPSMPCVPNAVEHKVTLLRGQWRLNGEINRHTSGLPCNRLSRTQQLSRGAIRLNVELSQVVLWHIPRPWNHLHQRLLIPAR